MSAVFFEELELTAPDYNLAIGGGTHGQNTGRMIEKIEELLLREKPDRVLVYGDTDSTLAGALAAVKLHIPVAHVEAGLRSFNRRMPEEINRVLTDHAADLLFTPTDTATRNLASEGIEGEAVRQVGDVVYDAALYYGERSEQTSRILDKLDLRSKRYVLVTLHRAENTDDIDRMRNIIAGFAMIRAIDRLAATSKNQRMSQTVRSAASCKCANYRSGRLSGYDDAGAQRGGCCYRFRGRAERGVLPSGAVRYASRGNGVGGIG